MPPSTQAVTRVCIRSEADIVTSRQQGRRLAAALGFSSSDAIFIATAISEVTRNILTYAGSGELAIGTVEAGGRRGLVVVASDQGPGIADVALALQDHYSTSSSLGLGLPGARRLMDELEIASEVGKGTVVTMRKWLPRAYRRG